MNQTFGTLKQKIQHADKDQIKDIIQSIRKEKGNIDEKEKQSLNDLAKQKAGDNFDLGKFRL